MYKGVTMDSYLDFADVYDEFMDQTPYEEWKTRIISAIKQYGISKPVRVNGRSDSIIVDQNRDGVISDEERKILLESERNLVVDLGCGTGTLTEMLADEGYDMIGVDYSDSMLEKAYEKREKSGSEILYLNQDMRELELYSTVGTVVSVCDSINYVIEPEDLKQTIALVHNYLYPQGLFIFDFNTDYKYREIIGDTTIAENRDECSFIWDNFYDPDTHINEYDLTIFIKDKDEYFRRIQETHLQRGFEPEEIETLLKEQGFEIISFIDSDTQGALSEETERVFVIARCIKD